MDRKDCTLTVAMNTRSLAVRCAGEVECGLTLRWPQDFYLGNSSLLTQQICYLRHPLRLVVAFALYELLVVDETRPPTLAAHSCAAFVSAECICSEAATALRRCCSVMADVLCSPVLLLVAHRRFAFLGNRNRSSGS